MKFKPDLIALTGLLILATSVLPVFKPNLSNTQIFLSAIFSYIGFRLFIYVYKNNKTMW